MYHHKIEQSKKLAARSALDHENWEDDHDLDDDREIAWSDLGFAWDQDLLWDEHGPIPPEGVLFFWDPKHTRDLCRPISEPDEIVYLDGFEGMINDTEDDTEGWDLVTDDLSDAWSVVSENT